jgi:hypothetical protein
MAMTTASSPQSRLRSLGNRQKHVSDWRAIPATLFLDHMEILMSAEYRRTIVRSLIYGSISIALYTLLYFYNAEILALSREGRWNFIIPMAIAFTFSIVHGNFTGQFWDLFGVKAKTTKK